MMRWEIPGCDYILKMEWMCVCMYSMCVYNICKCIYLYVYIYIYICASSTWLIHRSHDSFAVLLEAEETGTPLSSALPYLRHKFQVQSTSLGRQQGVFRLHGSGALTRGA